MLKIYQINRLVITPINKANEQTLDGAIEKAAEILRKYALKRVFRPTNQGL